jgi:sigma-B regulation protein RsbU (phosphoserine phosphatase)
MAIARLEVTEALGQRIVAVDKPCFRIGRRDTNDLKLAGSEVSRDHAEIVEDEGRYVLRDRGSRYGSFVNDAQVSEHLLEHGDRIRLGRGGGADLVFLVGEAVQTSEPATASAIGDLRHVAALLEGLRALGAGRVLDDVLALVLDSALAVSGAERGFIMLSNDRRELEFKLARARGRITLPGRYFEASRKIPQEVFETGRPRIEADLLEGDLPNVHMHTIQIGIRNVHCVPLRLVRYLDRQEAPEEEQRIGVLYLDSREKGALLSSATRSALDTLATEAAIAIENARLYRETMEKTRMEQEMRIAAEIQRALLPLSSHDGQHYEAAAATIPTRQIGGDFYDYADLPDGRFAFVLGDVAGKGPPAALLSALVQGMFAGQGLDALQPAETMRRINDALIRRAIEARYVTMMYGHLGLDGRLTYCNAGHNPPFVAGRRGVRRLETGGCPVGMFEGETFDQETLQLEPGEWIVVFTDGVSEALSVTDEEFGDLRLTEAVGAHLDADPKTMLDAIVSRVKAFTVGAPQNDDLTAFVIRYRG